MEVPTYVLLYSVPTCRQPRAPKQLSTFWLSTAAIQRLLRSLINQEVRSHSFKVRIGISQHSRRNQAKLTHRLCAQNDCCLEQVSTLARAMVLFDHLFFLLIGCPKVSCVFDEGRGPPAINPGLKLRITAGRPPIMVVRSSLELRGYEVSSHPQTYRINRVHTLNRTLGVL